VGRKFSLQRVLPQSILENGRHQAFPGEVLDWEPPETQERTALRVPVEGPEPAKSASQSSVMRLVGSSEKAQEIFLEDLRRQS